ASFAEALAGSTVTGATFQLRDGAGTLVPADVSYDAASRTAILRPRAPLAGLTTYSAKVTGGGAGVSDVSFNPLAQDRTWSFTTALPLNGPTVGGESTGSTSIAGGPGAGSHGSSSKAPVGPRIAVTPRTARVSKAGAVKLRVACPRSARSCRVTLRLQLGRRTLATKALTVAGGKTNSVTLKLSRTARRDLQRKRSLKVTAIVAARDKAGHPATTRTSIRLLAPSRR
ncbi:MAG TPA: Ig-like domain-containing protein, partial [Baekduia sp.]|nr:Ig-like domain-containing protein [Baekduia sp.]